MLMSEDELIDLLMVARDKNKEYHVTGMLLYCQGTFMQVIEGPKASIDLIYKAIESDLRHKNIIKLSTGAITERNFPHWSMAFASVNAETLQEIEGFLSVSSKLSIATSDHIAINMLKTFADNNKLYITF